MPKLLLHLEFGEIAVVEKRRIQKREEKQGNLWIHLHINRALSARVLFFMLVAAKNIFAYRWMNLVFIVLFGEVQAFPFLFLFEYCFSPKVNQKSFVYIFVSVCVCACLFLNFIGLGSPTGFGSFCSRCNICRNFSNGNHRYSIHPTNLRINMHQKHVYNIFVYIMYCTLHRQYF